MRALTKWLYNLHSIPVIVVFPLLSISRGSRYLLKLIASPDFTAVMTIAVASRSEEVPDPPRRSWGKGMVIRRGELDEYGNVEVTVIPKPGPITFTLKWEKALFGHCIPEEQREPVKSACRRVLEQLIARNDLRCGVAVTIGGGSYHEAARPAHAEAAEAAVRDALRRGRFIN